MNIREGESVWTKKEIVKSSLLFVLHLVILIFIAAILLLGDKFDRFSQTIKENRTNYLYMTFCIFLLVLITYFYYFFEDRRMLIGGKNIALIFTVLDLSLIVSFLFGKYVHIYARPVALAALLVFVLVGRRDAIFMNMICAILMFVVDNFSDGTAAANNVYSSFIIAFSAGMIAIFFGNKAKTRFQIVGIGLIIVIPVDFIIFLLEVSGLSGSSSGSATAVTGIEKIFQQMGYGLLGGIMSAVLFLAILPVFESLFNCLTVFRLRELTSSDAKLLKKLKEEAPGTFNHSMVVAQLAEACAANLGEDVDYARAAAFYHDVGKLHQPEYFTENQGEYNLHDELTPELSADIIRSHTQDGYELIRAHHLPQFLADVALQHHGTMPIRYFYAKALKMTDGELNIEDFSYPGPKPKTKIAAIIMIADASEAVVRALPKRTPEEVEKAVRGIIEERMDLEQFSDCDITMADLTTIRRTLVSTLTGVYHHRVKYPSIKYKHADGKTTGENQ
jgi:7TM receptor with intracellular metal dependent phosphohydrolase